MERSPRAPSPLRWPSGQRSAGHRKRLLRPHVSLLQRLPAGALRQARSSQPGRSPVSRSPSADGPEERKLPPAGHPAQSEGKASSARGSEGALAPPAGRWSRVVSPCSLSPEGSPRSSSAGALRLEAQTQMEQNSSTTLLKTR